MFERAIKKASGFVRPIHVLTRNYEVAEPVRSTGTLFFVNDEGWALTVKRVIELFNEVNPLSEAYGKFKEEAQGMRGKHKSARLDLLEKKYRLTRKVTVEMRVAFVDCVAGKLDLETPVVHPELDLALIKFRGFDQLLATEFPVFPASSEPLQPGKFLCRLGYPFPDFSNYKYDVDADETKWIDEGRSHTSPYPMEGMVTRFLAKTIGGEARAVGYELSTPALRGMSGAPAVDHTGKVWGMQASINHLYMGFDHEAQIPERDESHSKIEERPFLHVSQCLHVDVMKQFMRANGVKFAEE